MTDTIPAPEFLLRNGKGKIAYHRSVGKSPGVVFLGGFMSDMTGSKATHLESHCTKRGQSFLRFDYTGHGQSDGHFIDGTIGAWAEDALDAFDALTEGPQILVGSSMGGWMMLLLAKARPERVAGLVGIAAAPDFTEDLMWASFDEKTRKTIMETGLLEQPSEYSDEPYRITRDLITNGRENLVLPGEAPIAFTGPARFLHGTRDADVPWQLSVTAAEKLSSDDVRVDLIKGGDHRLSTPENLAHLSACIEEITDIIS